MTEEQTPAKAAAQAETITLDTPITRGSKTVSEITVRKPLAGALRGVSLVDVLQMDVSAATKLLPRITSPALTEADIRDMDPADLFQLASQVANFLLPKHMRQDSD